MEQLRDPSLGNKPIAIQQHGDIIAANAPAKAAGVRKHIPPDEARRLLKAVHGKVVHVHVADGHRISYSPYRRMSARFHRVLQRFEAANPALLVEKASIDEAFIMLSNSHAEAGAQFENVAVPACCHTLKRSWAKGPGTAVYTSAQLGTLASA